MMNMLKNLHKEESGQDLIEYGLQSRVDPASPWSHRWHGQAG